jgi:hypothetical protein
VHGVTKSTGLHLCRPSRVHVRATRAWRRTRLSAAWCTPVWYGCVHRFVRVTNDGWILSRRYAKFYETQTWIGYFEKKMILGCLLCLLTIPEPLFSVAENIRHVQASVLDLQNPCNPDQNVPGWRVWDAGFGSKSAGWLCSALFCQDSPQAPFCTNLEYTV